MNTVHFTCHGNSAPAYSCDKPGDQSGEYVLRSELASVKADDSCRYCGAIEGTNHAADCLVGNLERENERLNDALGQAEVENERLTALLSESNAHLDWAREDGKKAKAELADAQEIVQAETEARLAVEEENKRLTLEIEEGDYWQERAMVAFATGHCPICQKTDEEGHSEGCYIGTLETENERLSKELAEQKGEES